MKLAALCVGLGCALSSSFSLAASSCSEVVEELKAMKRAQQAILQSLAENHGGMSSLLNDFAAEADLAGGKIPSTARKSLRNSAKAYKNRESTALKQAKKLDAATEALIAEVQACLR